MLDGTTEHGDQFMSVRSYLPNEIHWGFTFAPIISCARGASTRHEVDIGRSVHCSVFSVHASSLRPPRPGNIISLSP